MKIAILADIHGNLPALLRVAEHIEAWRPDRVVMAGDVVNRGPQPQECLQFVLEKQQSEDWLFVRGNHEDYVLDQTRPEAPQSGPEFEIARNALWTYQQLNGEVSDLEAMPFQVSLTGPDCREVRIVHASMRHNRDGIFPMTPDDVLRRQIAPASPVLIVGHTHRPLVRQIDNTLLVNVGSVGMPFDGDKRAAYAQLTWQADRWRAEIIRLEYGWQKTEADFFDTGFLAEAGDLAQVMLLELRRARSYIHLWIEQYQTAVLARDVSMADSVRAFLDHYTG